MKSIFKKFLRIDWLVLLFLPLLAVFISSLVHLTFLVSIFLFLGLPAAYLSIRAPKYILKSIIFSLLASLPLMVILEYIGGFSLAWAFPPSVFSFYLFGRVSLEVLIWAFLNVYTVVIFYEFIFDQHSKVYVWSKKMWMLVCYLIVWAVLFLFLLIFRKGAISFPYFYLLFGLVVFIFPLIMAALYYPKVLPRMFYSLIYFSFLSLLYEVTALHNGWWYFPGTSFVGYIRFLDVTFPLEEFIFWIILFAPAVVSAFEYLDDDCK